MNPVDWSIRQHIYEQLQNEDCVDLQLGIPDWKDSSYRDYSDAIGFKLNTNDDSPKIKILIKNCVVKCILATHIMAHHVILTIEVDPSVPEFEQLNDFYKLLLESLGRRTHWSIDTWRDAAF